MKSFKHRTKGFTLIETLVAVSILVLASLGPLSVATNGIKNSILAKGQVTAYYLAEEGIEAVRAVRDSNIIRSQSWLTGLEACATNDGCYIDSSTLVANSSVPPTINACSGSCPAMSTDADGYYGYSQGGSQTLFTRTIKIKNVPTDSIPNDVTDPRNINDPYALNDERVVEVTMNFKVAGFSKTFTISETILNLN